MRLWASTTGLVVVIFWHGRWTMSLIGCCLWLSLNCFVERLSTSTVILGSLDNLPYTELSSWRPCTQCIDIGCTFQFHNHILNCLCWHNEISQETFVIWRRVVYVITSLIADALSVYHQDLHQWRRCSQCRAFSADRTRIGGAVKLACLLLVEIAKIFNGAIY